MYDLGSENNFIQDQPSRFYAFPIPPHWIKECIEIPNNVFGPNVIYDARVWIENRLDGFWSYSYITDSNSPNKLILYFESEEDLLLFKLGGGLDLLMENQ